MPPRIPVWQCLRAQSTPQPSCASRALSTTPSSRASTVTQKRKHRDPYAIAQAKARKAANLSRQEVLKKERASVLGDPVRGETTPFVRSFDNALPPEPSPSSTSTHTRIDQSPLEDAPGPRLDADNHLNFFLSKDELENIVQRSKWLTQPLPEQLETEAENQQRLEAYSDRTVGGDTTSEPGSETAFNAGQREQIQDLLRLKFPTSSEEAREAWMDGARSLADLTQGGTREQRLKEEHERAEEALKRILSLSLGSSKDRIRVNTQRCVDVFGRHNTDQSLAPRPKSADDANTVVAFPRIGKDTGSSEVQIAILTAKIRTLADSLELRGHPDKVNKRNLRLLVHRRAKLLQYLRRKERGGPRWQHLIEKLGLTEGTWKGEISL